MDRRIELLRELQGDATQAAFAKTIGVSQQYMSAIYTGRRKPSVVVVPGLLRAYPDRRGEIIATWYAEIMAETSQEPWSEDEWVMELKAIVDAPVPSGPAGERDGTPTAP